VRSTAAVRCGRTALAALASAALAAVGALALAPDAPAQFRHRPWATINACDPPAAPGSVGVRVSVPNRADAAQWVRIRIQFFDGTRGSWRVVREGGEGRFTKLSDGGGRVFGGTTFTFNPPSPGNRIKLRGLVDVEWRRGRRVRSHAQVVTHGGHQSGVDPLLALSAPFCEITR
jgi:hypothetical protein